MINEKEILFEYYKGSYSKKAFNKLYPVWMLNKNEDIFSKIKIIRSTKKAALKEFEKIIDKYIHPVMFKKRKLMLKEINSKLLE